MARRNQNGRKADSESQGGMAPARSLRPSAPDTPAPDRPRLSYRTLAKPMLLALVSAVLLTLAFPPVGLSGLAYVALVPLVVMTVRTPSGRAVFLAAWVGGLLFFGVNMWWFWPVTKAGAIAMIPYMGLYWAAFAWLVRRIGRALPVPLTLLAPLVWVTLEVVRGWLLTGMPWVFVGHTQYENLTLIQIADALGAYGNSFLCLMTTGLVADFLVRPLFRKSRPETPALPPRARFSRILLAMMLLVAVGWAGTVAYGQYRLVPDKRRSGPVVTSIQTSIRQDVKNIVKGEQMQSKADQERQEQKILEAEHEMLDQQLDLTRKAVAEAGTKNLRPDLVIWPETMVPGIQNQEFLEYDSATLASYPTFAHLQTRSRGFWEEVRQEARTVGAPILFGGHSVDLMVRYDLSMLLTNSQNTALLVGPRTPPYRAEHTYAKAHLVPFGEYVPFKESWPWLNALLRGFTPYDYDYSLTPGAHDQAPFVLKYDGGEARFQVPICYEDALPYRIREMIASGNPLKPKAVDFLINISNDGWFDGSVELDQHLALCVFRAVESRVPIVRAVNTGISAIIASDGRIEQVVADSGGRRHLVTGFITGRLALDDRLAPYTEAGDLFARVCMGIVAVLALTTLALGFFSRRRATGA
jgi:apolipoprotein N-acyltransferase